MNSIARSAAAIFTFVMSNILFVNSDDVLARVSPQSGFDTVVGRFARNDVVEDVSDERIGREAFIKVRVVSSDSMPIDMIVFVPNRYLDREPVERSLGF